MKNKLNTVKKLLESEDSNDLVNARILTREILTWITENISSLFIERQKLMWMIASSKRKAESILQLWREYELI